MADDWARLDLRGIDIGPASRGEETDHAGGIRSHDPTLGGRSGTFRQGFGSWGVGWGLQNSGGGPQGYGWGGGWQGGHGEIFRGSGFGGGLAGSPEVREPGGHAGRGPKGHSERADERLRERVADRLTEDAWIDASEITIAVSRGEVTLEGAVLDREMKRRAERVVEECPGVRDVHNHLRISRASAATPSR